MLEKINNKLAEWGEQHLKAIKFGIQNDIDINEVSMFLAYQRALISKATMCSGCLDETHLEDICSRLLRILDK